MTPAKLKVLRELAEKADPGPWHRYHYCAWDGIEDSKRFDICSEKDAEIARLREALEASTCSCKYEYDEREGLNFVTQECKRCMAIEGRDWEPLEGRMRAHGW